MHDRARTRSDSLGPAGQNSTPGMLPLLDHMSRRAPLVFIMAAGLGTRMKSDLPKVLHRIAGRPGERWVRAAAPAGGAGRVVAIRGHKHDVVKTGLDASFGAGAVDVALQMEQ